MAQPAYQNTRYIFFSAMFLFCLAAAIWFGAYYLIAVPFAFLFFYKGWQQVNSVFLLLLFSLPFSTELQFSPSLATDFPDELMMIFTAGLCFCYWLLFPSVLPRTTIVHPLIILLLISIAWAVLTTIFSTHTILSVKFLLAKSWYMGAFVLAPLIVFREKKLLQQAIMSVSIAMLIVVLITMARHYFYGFSFGGINMALKPFFRNHVNYSAMLVCLVPVFFAFYKLSASRSLKRMLVVTILLLLTALFFSYARGAWLALFMGLIAYWLLKKKLMLFAYFAAIIILVASLFWIKADDRYLGYAHDYRTTIFHQDFREHLQATYEFKDVSTAERFYRWIAGVRMIKDNPLTGFGPSTFYNNYKPYAIPAFKTWVSDNQEKSTVHNYFLLLAIEQGLPGLLFFLLLAGAMLFYAQGLYHRVEDPFYKMAAIISGVVLVMILTVNFLSDLIETDKVGSLFFLCLSILVITDLNTRKRDLLTGAK